MVSSSGTVLEGAAGGEMSDGLGGVGAGEVGTGGVHGPGSSPSPPSSVGAVRHDITAACKRS
jgi:hypothetical protein